MSAPDYSEAIRRLASLTWADFKDAPAPDLAWLWEGLVPAGVPGMLASKPGHGKTWLALQLAVGVAAGLPVLGHPTSGPGGVIVLEMEQGRSSLHQRLRAIVQGYGDEWKPEHDVLLASNLVILVPQPETAMDQSFAALLPEVGSAAAGLASPLQLIVVDTLAAVSEGDENKAEAVRPIWAMAHALATFHGCTVMFLHHFRKVGIGSNLPPLEARMDPEALRGSNAQEGSARFALQFGWITEGEAQKVGLDPDAAHRKFGILGLTKHNDGPLSPWVLLEHGHTGAWEAHPHGPELLAALRGPKAQERLAAQDKVLVAILQAHQAGQKLVREDLAQRLYPDSKNPASTLRAVLSKLRAARLLGRDGDTLTPTGFQRAQLLAQPGATEDFQFVAGAA